MNEIEDDQAKWELRKGDVLIGTLDAYYKGTFWFTARFTPTHEFETYRKIFGEGHFYDNKPYLDNMSWGKWMEQIKHLGMHLIRLSDQAIPSEFILHVKGDRADFRVYF